MKTPRACSREGGAGAVAQRHHDVVGARGFAAGQHHAAQVAHACGIHVDQQVIHALREADFAAQAFDDAPHVLHHRHQAEGADVRLADVEDFIGRTGLHEFVQHLAAEVALVADLAVELAVGKRARTALAVLHVRLGVQHFLAPQAEGVHGALAHLLAALQHDGLEAHLRQHECCEQPAGAHADHDRAQRLVRRRLGDDAVGRVGRRGHLDAVRLRLRRHALQHRRLIGDVDIHRVDQLDLAALAGVVAALGHGQRTQRAGLQLQTRQHRVVDRGVGVVERQRDVGESKHGARSGGAVEGRHDPTAGGASLRRRPSRPRRRSSRLFRPAV
ncbi:MAG: hypothetical protein ACK52N_04470 [Lysobacteraceae bacterium]